MGVTYFPTKTSLSPTYTGGENMSVETVDSFLTGREEMSHPQVLLGICTDHAHRLFKKYKSGTKTKPEPK